jgi:hypothetical protein
MMMHIDVSSVLRQTVSCELYSNLVTRPTGRRGAHADRSAARDSRERSLTVIDFSHVGMIDFSCADEVIAKLLLRYANVERTDREAYFLFRGVTDDHWDAIETVLERHRLALVLETDDGARVVGNRERRRAGGVGKGVRARSDRAGRPGERAGRGGIGVRGGAGHPAPPAPRDAHRRRVHRRGRDRRSA